MLGVPINMYCNSLYIEKKYCKVKFNFTLMALALCFYCVWGDVAQQNRIAWLGGRAGANLKSDEFPPRFYWLPKQPSFPSERLGSQTLNLFYSGILRNHFKEK